MVYLDDPAALLDRIRRLPGIGARVMAVRPTDLEDVFLSLTGTSLEDNP